jgi:hypothetical protein
MILKSSRPIMVLAAFLGLINAFDTPIRQAFTTEMIEKKEDLGNAIALNSAIFNGFPYCCCWLRVSG